MSFHKKENIMRRSFFGLLLILLVSLSMACNTSKTKAAGDCDIQAEVKDFSQLDGCGLLIVTPDGKKLSPVNWEKWSSIAEANTKITLGYKEVEPRMSICMTESAFIEITCASVRK